MGAKAKSRILTNLGISIAAALVPPAFLRLLSPPELPVPLENLAMLFVVSVVYALAITFLADFTLHYLHRYVVNRAPVVQWTVLVFLLVAISTVGCVLGTIVLMLLHSIFPGFFFPWSDLWTDFYHALKLCVFITVVFGVAIAAYEQLRDRLDATQLKLRTEELERERAIKLATEARLAALQSRVHPHFLFNTLNSISSLIPADPERAERLIERMAALLRFSMEEHRGGLVPLQQELKVVHDYLEIEKARLGKRLEFRVEPPGELSTVAIPPLSVQTLVENAIKYAVAPNREGGEIRVQAMRNNGSASIEVADTGQGFSLDWAPAGHGIDNLRNQLAVLFGDAAALSVHHSEGWNRVSLKVPA